MRQSARPAGPAPPRAAPSATEATGTLGDSDCLPREPMSQRPPDPKRTPPSTSDDDHRLTVSPIQVIASALASVSAAIVASLFNVAGTIVGTVLVSVVATLGAAINS